MFYKPKKKRNKYLLKDSLTKEWKKIVREGGGLKRLHPATPSIKEGK